MTEKGGQKLNKYILVAFIVILFIICISIIWTFLTTDYPTHSDVFWTGAQFGVLTMVLLLSVFLIGFSMYHYFESMRIVIQMNTKLHVICYAVGSLLIIVGIIAYYYEVRQWILAAHPWSRIWLIFIGCLLIVVGIIRHALKKARATNDG